MAAASRSLIDRFKNAVYSHPLAEIAATSTGITAATIASGAAAHAATGSPTAGIIAGFSGLIGSAMYLGVKSPDNGGGVMPYMGGVLGSFVMLGTIGGMAAADQPPPQPVAHEITVAQPQSVQCAAGKVTVTVQRDSFGKATGATIECNKPAETAANHTHRAPIIIPQARGGPMILP